MKEVTKGLIALVAVVAIAGGIYGYEKLDEGILKEGDFAEIYYIGYLKNNTVFSSSFEENVSYDTPFDDHLYNLTPLKLFMGDTIPTKYPDGWSYGDLGLIEGMKPYEFPPLYEALKGMKKGEEKTVNVDAKDAFGMPVENGTIFNTSMIFGFNATFQITSIGGVTVDIRWLPEEGQIITMPQYWYDAPVQDPHWLWENATRVVSFNDTHVTLETTPNKLDNITLYPWWEGDSTVHYNDTTISIVTTPPLDNFTISYMGYTIYGRVLNVTDDKIKIEYYAGNETIQDELNRTLEFSRQIDMPRAFSNVQKAYIEDELKQQGYSFHELAGNGVTFRIKLLRIYRVS